MYPITGPACLGVNGRMMLNAYTVDTGSIYSDYGNAKSVNTEISGILSKIGDDFNPWYSSRLFLSAGTLCFRDESGSPASYNGYYGR
jgi:hypothetical protein